VRRKQSPAAARGESGFTLIELAIVLGILSLVMAIFLPTLYAVQRGFDRQSDRSQSNDNARLAAEELDREIRSGNVLYNPGSESDPANQIYPGMSLRIYTQTNANIRNPGFQCVQWRVASGQLQRRSWSTTWRSDGNVTAWRIVAEHVVNQPNPPSPPVTPAFQLDPDPNKGGRTVIVTLMVNQNAASGRTVTIQESITGRNTEYGYPNNVCTDIPPY
jgi:prepilin-type N-terminal cleavage/methylation domain-containing protein